MSPKIEGQVPHLEKQNDADRIFGYLALSGVETQGQYSIPPTINLNKTQPDLKVGNAIISIN